MDNAALPIPIAYWATVCGRHRPGAFVSLVMELIL